LANRNKVVSVFGSAAPSPGSPAYEEARLVGHMLAKAGCTVATGGYSGTMSAVSQGASEAGGHVIGVTSSRIETFRGSTLNRWVEEVIQFESLADRLLYLVKNNQGMIVLPGGIGTLSETALAWSLLQVGEIEQRPIALLGAAWRQTIRAFANSDYIEPRHLALLHFSDSAEDAVAHVTSRIIR